MDNPVTFSDITLLNTLATCANMTTDEVFKDFKIMANKKILKNHKYEIYYSESEKSWRTYLPDETKPNKRRPNVNTGGVPLTVFELVTATYATRDFDLRKDWVQCRNTICGFGDTLRTDLFDGIDETTFLTTVCLYTSYLNKQSGKANTISCKKKDVLGLSYESYIANRDAVLSGFKIAKEFLLRDQCVFRQRDLPIQRN